MMILETFNCFDYQSKFIPNNVKGVIMKKDVLLILTDSRQENAEKVQKILTAWGCLIKTRLGIHDGVLENCSQSGLIFLELVGDKEKHDELTRKLNLLKGVNAKLVELAISDE